MSPPFKTIRATFEYVLDSGIKINIMAEATDVTPYEVDNLSLRFFTDEDVPFMMSYDKSLFNELETLAIMNLQEVMFSPEVELDDYNDDIG
jgi:hypothetical protein